MQEGEQLLKFMNIPDKTGSNQKNKNIIGIYAEEDRKPESY